MVRCVVVLLFVLVNSMAHANVTCSGIPQRVYAGAHGPNDAEGKFWVVFADWQQYLLGHHSDSLSKSRFALAQTALATGKSLELSFFFHSTCEQARIDAALPTAVAVAQ